MAGNLEKTFLNVLRDFIFDSSTTVFAELSAEDRQNICALSQKYKLQHLLAYYLGPKKLLPPEYCQEFLKIYHASVGRELRRDAGLRRMRQLLQENNIDYIALKGSFLAYFCYPNPALRPSSDIDILIRERDLTKMADVFHAAGWTDNDHQEHSLHITALVSPDKRMLLEPHHTIFKAHNSAADNEKLWSMAVKGSGNEYFLPPEVVLLHLLDNALRDRLEFGLKPLADSAYLLSKQPVSVAKLQSTAQKLGITVEAGLLFSAFNDFFPEPYNHIAADAPAEVVAAFRNLTLHGSLKQLNSYELTLNREFKGSNWRQKIAFMAKGLVTHPDNLRIRYNLTGNYQWKLVYYYIVDILRKISILWQLKERGTIDSTQIIANEQRTLQNYLNK